MPKNTNYPEKHKKVLDILVKGQEFYSVKELEKLAKPHKITQNELKNILQDLLENNSIECDKFGSLHYYWSFPHKKFEEDKKLSENLKLKNKELHDKIDELNFMIKEHDAAKTEPTDENKLIREQLTNEMEYLKVEEKDLIEYINNNETCSLEDTDMLKTSTEEIVTAVNRWTDNIYNMKSWFKRTFPAIIDEKLEAEFNIPPELDYL